MAKKILNRKKLNPSQPVFTGIKHADSISLQLFNYNTSDYNEDTTFSVKKFSGFPDNDKQHWLNVHGIHDVEQIGAICDKIGIHQLAIQDILDVNQRPKLQEYEHYWFFSIKSMLPAPEGDFASEQLSFILGKNFLVSFQERKADYFDHVRTRIRNNVGILRERGSDYLLYLLIESIMDNYFKTLTNIEENLDKFGLMDTNIDPSPSILKKIEIYKRHIHQVKKTLIPVKEFVTRIEREQIDFVQQRHLKYFYELKDLSLSLIDDCEQIEMRLDSQTNLYFSIQGHRMNQVMKTLTVVATIFIPLTFIAGIYGMNFSNMPELNWKWGYAGIWGIMILVSVLMLGYFRRKKWF